MKGVLRGHLIGNDKETYFLKFKDKPDRSAFRITQMDESNLILKEIRIEKVFKENNMIKVELIK